MSNISFFFPKERKGSALGLNAGLGNLGVSVVQLVVPLVITTAVFGGLGGDAQTVVKAGKTTQMWLQNAGFIWVPFILASTLAAWFGMNDIASAKASFTDQAVIFKRKHNWIMCWLYLGTFGSFIGFSAGFPLLIKSQFPGVNPLDFAWMGPFVGALIRPVGGWLADKVGGARVTLWNFVAMIVGVLAVLKFLPHDGVAGNLTGFFLGFMVLFITAGIGNGSTFRMIPVIFTDECLDAVRGKDAAAQADAVKEGNKRGAAVLGFSAALGAYGGFFIPKSYGTSISMTGSPHMALWAIYLALIGFTVLFWKLGIDGFKKRVLS
jgi:NNP family nitrate/nitrite transporter-like MFS transporter